MTTLHLGLGGTIDVEGVEGAKVPSGPLTSLAVGLHGHHVSVVLEPSELRLVARALEAVADTREVQQAVEGLPEPLPEGAVKSEPTRMEPADGGSFTVDLSTEGGSQQVELTVHDPVSGSVTLYLEEEEAEQAAAMLTEGAAGARVWQP